MEVSMILPTKLPKAKDDVKILDGYYVVACREDIANEWMDYERMPVPSSLSYAQAKLKELKESDDSKWANYIIIKVENSSTKFNEDKHVLDSEFSEGFKSGYNEHKAEMKKKKESFEKWSKGA